MVKQQQQVPSKNDKVLVAREHEAPFAGDVISVDVEKREAVVVGHTVMRDGTPTSTEETRVVSFSSIERINGRYVMARLYDYRGWHPAASTIIDVGTQRQCAKENQEDILWSSLKHMGRHAHSAHEKLIYVHANNARAALEELLRENAFDTVAKMVPQLMAMVVTNAIEHSGDEFADAMTPFYRVQSAILHADKVALKEMLNPKTFAQYFGEDE